MEIKVGQEIPGLVKEVAQETINMWAHLSKDYNPIHVDPEFAKATKFGGTIAHGHLALSYLGEMMLSWTGPTWLTSGKLTEIKFVSPVYPGRAYRIGGLVTDILQTEEDQRQISCDVYVRELNSDRNCVTGKASFALSGNRA